MKFEFTGRHIDVTPALKAHVEGQFEKLGDLFDTKPSSAHVIIEVERGRHRSEVIMNWRNEVLTAESSNSDMYQSLSQTITKIEKQARRIKEKVIDKSQRGGKATEIIAPAMDLTDDIADETDGPQIFETDGMAAKPMDPEEAATELSDSAQQFIAFRNSADGKMAVLFKREDGHFGLIRG